jgi:phospholipase C
VSNTVYDHTSVLATIEAKWNLPACTYRDASASTLMDCLQASPALLDPPELTPATAPLPGGLQCSSPVPSSPALP